MDTAQGELKVLKAMGWRGQFQTEFFLLPLNSFLGYQWTAQREQWDLKPSSTQNSSLEIHKYFNYFKPSWLQGTCARIWACPDPSLYFFSPKSFRTNSFRPWKLEKPKGLCAQSTDHCPLRGFWISSVGNGLGNAPSQLSEFFWTTELDPISISSWLCNW